MPIVASPRITVRLTQAQYDLVKARAAAERRTLANALQVIVENALAGNLTPTPPGRAFDGANSGRDPTRDHP